MTDPSIQGKNILITGGAGFIGSHIADALVRDNQVVVLDDFSSGTESNIPAGVDIARGSVLDESMVNSCMKDIDIVFHQAAIVSVERSIRSPLECHRINVEGTLQLLEAARVHGGKVILASSAAIYGHPDRVPISEDDKTNPLSPYGLDKMAIDEYASLYNLHYGVDTVALRYFNVYGPRQTAGDYSGVIETFLTQALSDESITVHGDGRQTRDFIHVDDVVRANLLAASTPVSGTAYNIGTGTEQSIDDLAHLVQELVDSTSPIEHTQPRSGDIQRSCASIDRARSDLGFEPTIDLKTGLESVLEVRQ